MLRGAIRSVAGVAEAAIAPLGAMCDELREQRRSVLERDHRSWPLPRGPWLVGQTWRDLLFAHWPVQLDVLRDLVPAQLAIDGWDGVGWLGVTPFEMRGLRLRGSPPIPVVSAFPEVNVRTYVTVSAKPGIWFFSLDADCAMAVTAARLAYRLPYFRAEMEIRRAGATIAYRSERRDARSKRAVRLAVSYGPAGPELGSRDELGRWLAERYCLYTVDEDGTVFRADIHHRPWPLQPAWAEFTVNTMAEPLGIRLDGVPLLHYSRRQDTLIWPLRPAGRP